MKINPKYATTLIKALEEQIQQCLHDVRIAIAKKDFADDAGEPI